MPATWKSQPLDATHELSKFTCGVESLDRWIRELAVRAQKSGTAATYVWTPDESADVVAYFSIAPTQVLRVDMPSAKNLAGGASIVPAYLIARLALDQSLRSQGLGTQLLLNALEKVAMAADTGGGRLVVVDAIDEKAAEFYERNGFRPTGLDSRLVMKISTARQVLEL